MIKWKFQQFKPPKARGSMKAVNAANWVAETKYDGDRRIAQFCFDAVRFTGTRESVDGSGFVEKTANLPHLNKPVRYLEGTVLDGEIVCAEYGARSRDVASVMGSSPEVAIAKQEERGWLSYVVFDCLFYRGTDIRQRPLSHRRAVLEKAVERWKKEMRGGFIERVLVAARFSAAESDGAFEHILECGGEGVVYKDLRAHYGDERAWVKRKGEATYDVVITGYEPGKGKYKGQVGAVKFGQYRNGQLVPCGQCSGMTDAVRALISATPKRYLMKVIEIKANAREPSGKFRHPQFVQLRADKSPKQCIFNLEEQ